MTISQQGATSIEERMQELITKARTLYAEAAQCEAEASRLATQVRDELLQQAAKVSEQVSSLLVRASKINEECFHQVREKIRNACDRADDNETQPNEMSEPATSSHKEIEDARRYLEKEGLPDYPAEVVAKVFRDAKTEQPEWSTDDWRTPNEEDQPIVDLVKAALGGAIGLDPTADRNKTIPAQRHFTKADDCLSQSAWTTPAGTVFMNPPYSNPKPFLEKLFEQMDLGYITEAIVLLPTRCLSNKGTGPMLLGRAAAHCLWNSGRIAFIGENGTPKKGANFDSFLAYFGNNKSHFAELFSQYGNIVYDRVSESESIEQWYYPDGVPYKRARYCANWDFEERNAQIPESLQMRLYNRSKNRLEKMCEWAITEGFAKSWSLLEEDSPLKELSGKTEASLILSHPEGLKLIADLDPKADPPKSYPSLGAIGQLFFPGDRVKFRNRDNEHIISYLEPPTETQGWVIFLTNAKTGCIENASFEPSGLTLVEAAPSFSNAYKTTPYTGMKVGDRVWLKTIPWADSKINIPLSYEVKCCETQPLVEYRIAAFLDNENVALYKTRGNNKPFSNTTIIVPPTALVTSDEIQKFETAPEIPSSAEAALEGNVSDNSGNSSQPNGQVAFDFLDVSEAKEWESWFSTICERQLNPQAKAQRLPKSKMIKLLNLTTLETKILLSLELPLSVPKPKEARQIWEEAKALAAEKASITES